MKLALNEHELGALAGLPHSCIVLYLWIRGRMDYSTAMVGVNPRVSWHGFTEWLYVEPHSGPGAHGAPSVQQVRRMARHLVRAGLVRMHSLMNERQLVFECVLARRDKHARNQPDRDPTGQSDRQPDRGLQSEKRPQPDRQPDRGKETQPDRHPVLSSKSTTTPSRPPRGAENATAREGHSTAPTGAEWSSALIYPSRLTATEKGACSKWLSAVPELDAQELLDELAGALQTKDIPSRMAYFRALVRRYTEGNFTAVKAYTVREQREQATKREAELARFEQAAPAPTAGGKRLGRGDLKAMIDQRRKETHELT